MPAHSILISPADPASPDAAGLLERHHRFTLEQSPLGACYTFDVGALSAPDMKFWIARLDGSPVGCAALKLRDDALAELKSMHVLEEARGAGIARALLDQVFASAREAGYERIGLETGRSDGFAASRRLYEAFGFQPCPAFAPYRDESFSLCMLAPL